MTSITEEILIPRFAPFFAPSSDGIKEKMVENISGCLNFTGDFLMMDLCVCCIGPTCADVHDPCEPSRCHPSSQCQALPEGGYKCECPMGREGKHCEKGKLSKNGVMPSLHALIVFSHSSKSASVLVWSQLE